MATIQDVVERSGVSIATVSRVINNSPKVAPETREKVLKAIQELDYHPNKLAQQFRNQQTGNILVLLPRLGDDFYSEILKGIDMVADEANYHVFVGNTKNSADIERYFFETLVQKQFDGIINFSACLPTEYMGEISHRYPVVVACRYLSNAQIPNVTIDNMAASREMTEYMLNLGHRRIAYFCGNTGLPIYKSRLDGFKQAFEERNMPVQEQLVFMAQPDIKGGYDAAMKLLLSGEDFSAIIASGDTLAVGAMKALEERGICVPNDVAVCGFDDIEISSLLNPALTTVRQPRQMIGRRSMEKLLARITGEDKNYDEQIVLPHEIVIRQSSGKGTLLE